MIARVLVYWTLALFGLWSGTSLFSSRADQRDQSESQLKTTAAADNFACTEDGSLGAPSGTPQHPRLLIFYLKSSPCAVAGVNYAVGYSNIALQDPIECHCLPSGASIDLINHFIRVTEAPALTLNGFDFSLHGGYLVYCDRSPNLTVSNSKFAAGENGLLGVMGNSGCADLTVTNNVFDGMGHLYPCGIGTVITTAGNGITLRYNWIKNFSQHVLEANGGGKVIYRYNVVEDGGWCPGAHLNYTQLQGDYHSPIIAFNTFIQNVQVAGGEGIRLSATSKIVNALVEFNTMISVPSGLKKALSYMIACHQQPNATNVGFVAKNNYLDIRGAYGAIYPSGGSYPCPKPTYTRNFNMTTGIALREQQ